MPPPGGRAAETGPDRGRHVEVTDRRTKHDFARQMQALVDRHFPDAEVIRVVLDNLNTHTPAALYEAFPPTRRSSAWSWTT